MYADAQIGKERATARLGADDQNNRQQVLSRPADMTRPVNALTMYASVQKSAVATEIIKPRSKLHDLATILFVKGECLSAACCGQRRECKSTARTTSHHNLKDIVMLYIIAIVLIVLWLLGLVTSYTIGGFIHILLVVAVIMILIRLISGRGV